MSFEQLKGLGWSVFISSDGNYAEVRKADRAYIATSWPMRETSQNNPVTIDQALKPVAHVAAN